MRPCTKILVCALLGLPFTASAEPPSPDTTIALDKWQERHRAATTAKYVLKWDRSFVKSSGQPPAGATPVFTGAGTFFIDLKANRLRLDTDQRLKLSNRPERLSRLRTSLRFDGVETNSYLAGDNDADKSPAEPVMQDIHIGPWNLGVAWRNEINPLLWAHGLIETESPSTAVVSTPFEAKIEFEQFAVVGVEVVSGRKCTILRDDRAPKASTTWWIDMERNCAVVRRLRVFTSGAVEETTIDYREHPQGWFPDVWTVGYAQPGEQPTPFRTLRVARAEFNQPIPDVEFTIALQPGLTVYKPGGIYRVDEDGSLQRVPPQPKAVSRPVENRVSDAIRGAGWWWVGAVVCCGVLVVIALRLRLRRRAV